MRPSERPGGGYADLSPINYLLRSARVFGDRPAVRGEKAQLSYAELLERAERLAGALSARGVVDGDRVATVLPNTEPMLEAHFAVPGSGAILVPLNHRLAAAEIQNLLSHAGASLLIADREFADRVEAAVAGLESPPFVILVQRRGRGRLRPRARRRRPHCAAPGTGGGGALDQLHERDHRLAQGRHVHAPRGGAARSGGDR